MRDEPALDFVGCSLEREDYAVRDALAHRLELVLAERFLVIVLLVPCPEEGVDARLDVLAHRGVQLRAELVDGVDKVLRG